MNAIEIRHLTRIMGVALFLLAVGLPAQEPRVIQSPGHTSVALTHAPPFAHWDLREFPDCRVPWVLSPGWVPDIARDGNPNTPADRDTVNTELRWSFFQWQAVTPAVIEFVEVNNPPPVTGIAMDGFNTLGFEAAPDDVQLADPADDHAFFQPGDAIQPDQLIIHPGGDRTLVSTPRGGELAVQITFAGEPMPGIIEPAAGVSDGVVSSIANDQAFLLLPFLPLVGPGPDGVLTTIPQGDDFILGGFVIDGGNRIPETRANNASPDPNALATTAVFVNNATGQIIEADTVFGSAVNWVGEGKNNICPPAANRQFRLRDVAIHEIGHFIGIDHPNMPHPLMPDANDGITPSIYRTLCPAFDRNRFAETLHPSDIESANFLYTPDLGDAPDPWMGAFIAYPTHERRNGGGRMLNGTQLDTLALGAAHWFGYYADNPPGAPVEFPFHFEHLGANAPTDPENPTSECRARLIGNDNEDDGVNFPQPLTRESTNTFVVSIRHTRQANRYDAADPRKMLYFNGYLDYNANGRWEANEHRLWWYGTHGNTARFSPNFMNANFANREIKLEFSLVVPPDAKDEFWCRFRLDYGENEGRVASVSGSLGPAAGLAQFGEVEDYKCETIAFREDRTRREN